MFVIRLAVALILSSGRAESITKKWKFTNNILDPQNWVGGKPSENCKGVIFPLNLGSIGSISKLYANEIVLPLNGEIEIKDGGFIEIAENSPCIRIKELMHSSWFSPDSWESTNNSAVPDIEKVPCMEDDVVFPKDDTVSVFYPDIPVQVHSVSFGGLDMTNYEWQNFLQSEFGENQFLTVDEFDTTGIEIQKVVCLSPGGCLCHGESDVIPWVCNKVSKLEAPCFDPVTPIGHCNEICGAIIHLTVTDNFVLSSIMSLVAKYDSIDVHVYASKVLQGSAVLIQIVLVDKSAYNELSTTAAYDLNKRISGDSNSLGVLTSKLFKSGMRLPERSSWFIIVLGTFFGTGLLFTIIYIVYIGSLQNYNFISRLPVREMSFANIRPMWFSKFENTEDGRLSMAASCVSLDKAFDNPMYEVRRHSAGSDALDVVLLDSKASTSKTTHENPTYVEEPHIEVIDIIKEGEK